MEFTKESGQATYQINRYNEGVIYVNNQEYRHSIIVMPEKLIDPWGPTSFETLTIEDFQLLIQYKPQLVLIGTGKTLRFPPIQLYMNLMNQKIGVEIMDTAAACRTYQILMMEGRQVAAALLLE